MKYNYDARTFLIFMNKNNEKAGVMSNVKGKAAHQVTVTTVTSLGLK